MPIQRYLKANAHSLFAASAIAGGAIWGVAAKPESGQARAAPAPAVTQALGDAPVEPEDDNPFLMAADPDGPSELADVSLAGRVVEQIDVEKYSYLRLATQGGQSLWTAVPRTASKLEQHVVVAQAEQMTNFASPTLKRSFDNIYFGVLDEAPDIHAAGSDDDKYGPHPGPGKGADNVPVGQIARAAGPLGQTVAELVHSAHDNAGKRARVRGVVVKSTPGVMGRTFLHLRDGSGDVADGSNDLTVTTLLAPEVRSEIELEGTIEVGADFGEGYRYDVLLADATAVSQ